MNQVPVPHVNADSYTIFTFSGNDICKLKELSVGDFGPFINLEVWTRLLLEKVYWGERTRDQHLLYLLQLATSDLILPIKKEFMKMYVNLNK